MKETLLEEPQLNQQIQTLEGITIEKKKESELRRDKETWFWYHKDPFAVQLVDFLAKIRSETCWAFANYRKVLIQLQTWWIFTLDEKSVSA